MTKEEAIKYLQQLYPNGGHCWLDEQRIEAIGIAVKALQEEPVSEEIEVSYNAKINEAHRLGREEGMFLAKTMFKEPVSKDLEEASKEWLIPQLDKSYANYGEAKMMELTHFDGYAMLDAIEFGAKWQKEQMIAKAIDAKLLEGHLIRQKGVTHPLHVGDKVKVIVIKED